jgi:hypothetical protein
MQLKILLTLQAVGPLYSTVERLPIRSTIYSDPRSRPSIPVNSKVGPCDRLAANFVTVDLEINGAIQLFVCPFFVAVRSGGASSWRQELKSRLVPLEGKPLMSFAVHSGMMQTPSDERRKDTTV